MRIFILDDEIHGYRKGITAALCTHDLTIATSIPTAKQLLRDVGLREHPNGGESILQLPQSATHAGVEARPEWRLVAQPFDLYLLDHDMHGFYEPITNDDTGSGLCRWLVLHDATPLFAGRRVILHSHNGLGRTEMGRLLTKLGAVCEEYPFSWSYPEWLFNTFGQGNGG